MRQARARGSIVTLAAWLILAAPLEAREGPPRVEVEVGTYHHDVDGEATDAEPHGPPDWAGQRVILRTRAGSRFVLQVEGTYEERGSEEGRLAAVATWTDLSPRVFLFSALTTSSGDGFVPDARADVECHVKVGKSKRTVLGAGMGRMRFEDSDVSLLTAAVTRYWPNVVLGYRFFRFDSESRKEPEPGAVIGGTGDTHLVQALLGNEERHAGRFDLTLLAGVDVRDFEDTGLNDELRSRVATLAWRRLWGRHVGTHVQLEWAEKADEDGTLTERRGLELRLMFR